MRYSRLLLTVAVLGAAFAAFAGVAGAQEPPVGNPPEPDDDLQYQIADMLIDETGGAAGVEEEAALWELIKQQEPDMTVTLGDAGVGGIAELPDPQGAPVQVPAQSSGFSPAILVALLIGALALGAVGWYARRRFYLGVLIVGITASVFLITPAEQTEAGLAACFLTTRDVEIDVAGFNYLWYAAVACAGEDFDKAHIFVDWEYYDWNLETWLSLECCIGSAGEQNDEDIIAWGAKTVSPYLGINCRRIDVFFWFEHSGRFQSFSLQSNGECY